MSGIKITARKVIALRIAALGGAAFSVVGGRGRNWARFFIWKLVCGKAHGGGRVSINDASIYYETFGAGAPVLVIHGGLGSIEGMALQIMELAKSHFVVAADTRGHGRSTASSAPLSYALIADDMAKLLDRLRLDQVDIVGWSDGGVVALDLAIHRSERVRKVIAISANADPGGLLGDPAGDSETPRAPLRYLLLAPNPAYWSALYRSVVSMWRTQPHYTSDELGRIKAPILIMAGQFDVVKPEHTDQLAKSIPSSRKVVIQGSTHAAPSEKPKIVNDHILKFLDDPF